MNNNEETDKPAVYPEQEDPPRPTYSAVIRGIGVGGWLYYHPTNGDPDNGSLNIVITIGDKKVRAEDFMFTSAKERSYARLQAKNLWRHAVLAIVAGI